MKRFSKYIPMLLGIALCFLIGVTLSFFVGSNDPSAEVTYIENSVDLYVTALQALKSDVQQLAITSDTKTTVDYTIYTQKSSALICFDKTDPDNLRYHIQNEINMGNHHITYDNYFIEGSSYMVISGVPFCETASIPEELISKSIEVPVLDHRLYDKIVGVKTDNGYRIEFSEATAIENWVGSQLQLEYASGIAILSNDGNLLSSTYTATVRDEFSLYEISLTLTPKPAPAAINLPDENWINLTAALSVPLLLEKSVGILVQASPIRSSYREEIYFEALGDKRTRSIDIQLNNSEPLSAKVITETSITNDSRLEQPGETVKTECFYDGIYMIEKGETNAVVDPSIDSETMSTYFKNLLISTIMLPKYIDSSWLVTSGTTIRYNFEGNDAFAQFLCHNVGQLLYQDSDLLLDKVQTEHLTCYLEIDSNTMLPLASGISYKASYQKEALPYHLTYEAHQTYQYTP